MNHQAVGFSFKVERTPVERGDLHAPTGRGFDPGNQALADQVLALLPNWPRSRVPRAQSTASCPAAPIPAIRPQTSAAEVAAWAGLLLG